MKRFMEIYQIFKAVFVALGAFIFTYFNTTAFFLYALLIGFAMNMFAGFRADEVQIKLTRIFPPKFFLKNFQGNKFKDSLMELLLTLLVTYIIKQIVYFFVGAEEQSVYIVQFFFSLQSYFYIKNALRNFSKVHPKYVFLRVLYYLISFKFKELVGSDVTEMIEKAEEDVKNVNKKQENETTT